MPKIDDGGPAYPRPISEDRTSGDLVDGNRVVPEQAGMSLRDHFAALAMQSLISMSAEDFNHEYSTFWKGKNPLEKIASIAYCQADAMLRAGKI